MRGVFKNVENYKPKPIYEQGVVIDSGMLYAYLTVVARERLHEKWREYHRNMALYGESGI